MLFYIIQQPETFLFWKHIPSLYPQFNIITTSDYINSWPHRPGKYYTASFATEGRILFCYLHICYFISRTLKVAIAFEMHTLMVFVTLTQWKATKTRWRRSKCIETCSSAYDIKNIINIYIYIVHLLVWIINRTRCIVHTSKLWTWKLIN